MRRTEDLNGNIYWTSPSGLRMRGVNDLGQVLYMCAPGPVSRGAILREVRRTDFDMDWEVKAQFKRIEERLQRLLDEGVQRGWLFLAPRLEPDYAPEAE
jgi:hypothetical protein